MKFLMLVLLVLAAPLAHAGKCEPLADAHKDFCATKPKDACVAHSSVCVWNDADQTVRVIIEKAEKCEAQDGKEAHETFCADKNKATCRVHTSVCVWR